MSSVRKIAEQSGVSITTVSRALNNDPSVNEHTRKHIITIANRVGYAATMGKRITTQIAFAYAGEQTISHPFDAAVFEGILRGVNECRFDVVILNLQRDKHPEETYTQFFMRKGVRGVILRIMEETRRICHAIVEEGFPLFVISERFESDKINCIDCDSKPDSIRAVEHLIALGHRRIAFGMHNIPDRDHMDRYEGYCEALNRHELPYDESLVFRQPYTLAGGSTVMKMIACMSDRPTAIYFADPMMGVGAIKQAREMGVQIPQDLSVIGFDDTDVRFSVHPTMTAVCQDASILGFEAASHLTQSLTHNTHQCLQKTIPTFFEINDSTGAPPLIQNGHSAHWGNLSFNGHSDVAETFQSYRARQQTSLQEEAT